MYKFKLSFKDDAVKSNVYLIASPIGNLQEFNPRAIDILKNKVDKLYCEDTRVTVKLLNNFNLSLPMTSLNKDNEKAVLEKIREDIKLNKSIAIMSDAGYPTISDPGYYIIKNLVEEDTKIIPVSGSSALLSALICSGLDTTKFLFYGFLSKNEQKRKKELSELVSFPHTMIFYESPNRIIKTLHLINQVLGERCVCVAKELTKIYEQFHYGLCSEIISNIDKNTTVNKGEYVIVVQGYQKSNEKVEITAEILNEISNLITIQKLKTKTAINQVADKYHLNKNELYKIYHQNSDKTKNDI